MTRHHETCIDCSSIATGHKVQREGHHLTIVETIFSCGARKREVTDTETNTGTVKFGGCGCGS